MSARPRQSVDRHERVVARRPKDDAVSPVVGMILVLAISIVGIASILYWGLPAIDEMKSNVEFRSVETQFHELDATIKELVAGTTEKTAKRWQPSLNRGQIAVKNNTEQWLYAIDLYSPTNKYDFQWFNLSDGNDSFAIRSANETADVEVKAYVIHGTSSSLTLNVTLAGAGSYPAQMSSSHLPTWTAGKTHVFRVTEGGLAYDIAEATFKFQIWSENELVAEAWYAATGRIDFNLDSGLGSKSVIANNGAVMTGVNGAYTITNSPPLPPPASTGGTPRIFARFVLLGGDTQFGGEHTFDVLISLYSTATLASYDCADLTLYSDCVGAVKFFNYGEYKEVWYNHLQNRARGYGYVEQSDSDGTQTLTYLEDRRPHMGFTLLQSSVRAVSS